MDKTELTAEGLYKWFYNKGFANSLLEDFDEHTEVLIDGTYDLELLAKLIAQAILKAKEEERENVARFVELYPVRGLSIEIVEAKAQEVREIAQSIRNRKDVEC